jgi:hypothetical protein
MCRVALFNKSGEGLIEKSAGLKAFLDRLEKDAGGAGNGLALLKNKEIILLEKGVKYSNEEIVKALHETDYDWALYHTRIPSVGDRTDENCHPFMVGETVLAMNGTESITSSIAKLSGMTDTEAVLRLIKAFDFPFFDTLEKEMNSTYMGFHNGVPYVVTHTKAWMGVQMSYDPESDGIVFASTISEPGFKHKFSPKRVPFLWTPEISDINAFEKVYSSPTKITSYSSYGSGVSGYATSPWNNVRDEKKTTKEVEMITARGTVFDDPREKVKKKDKAKDTKKMISEINDKSKENIVTQQEAVTDEFDNITKAPDWLKKTFPEEFSKEKQ